jgi:hypothetical protein
MLVYHESQAWDRARRRMRAPVLVEWFLPHGGNGRPARHVGPVCPRCGGPVLKGWSSQGRACAQCSRPW